MWRATWKGLTGHRLRFFLTGLAITLGVGLVAASFMFTDSLSRAFDQLFATSLGSFDVQVRPQIDPDLSFVLGEPLDEDLVGLIAGVEGVEGAQGSLFGLVQVVVGGEPVRNGAAPSFVVSWPELLGSFVVKTGVRPNGESEAALDAATARKYRLETGDTIELIGVGQPETFTVTGTAGLEGFDSFGGAVSAYVPLETAQRLLGLDGKVMSIEVAGAPEAEIGDLVERITPLLPEGVEAVDAQSAAQEQLATFKDALGFLNTFLLVFGGVTIFVAAFLIQNTFRIIVAQRIRELALLRAVGASRRQVLGMVLGEATVISLLAAAAGLGVGALLARAIRRLLSFGGSLPSAPLQLQARTVLVSLATGVGITLLSAVLPARSAASVPPIAALRDQPGRIGGRSLRIRAIVGVALTGLGVGLLASGLLIEIETEAIPEVALVGAGAGLIFVGVAVLAAVFARPVTTVLGRPLRALGVPGRLAADNAGRNPRRTAATSSALMVGLALVSLTLVMADSVKATAAKLLDDRFRADLVVAPAGFGGGRLSPLVADRLAQLPETHVVARLRAGQVEVNDDTRFLAGADLDLLVQALDFQMVDGDLTAMGDGQVALRKRVADQLGLQVGDTIEIVFARTGRQRLEVGAVWDAEGVGAGLLVSLTTYEANFTEPFDDQVYVVLKDPELGREAVEAVVGEFPGVEVSDQSEFKQQASIQVDQLVRLVFGLLGVAIVIGVLGITNTLSLSVLERTREIGLLRAVGMSRRQMRRAITWESVLIAVFGALLGVTLGLVFGWAVVAALQRDALVLSIPYARLALSVVAAMAAGIGAALLPGWRASRRNILQAIAYE